MSPFRLIRFFTAGLLLALVVCLSSNAATEIAYIRLAFMPFKNLTQDKDKNWIGEGISNTINSELSTIKQLILIERTQLADAIGTLNLKQVDLADEKAAAQIGKLTSARYVIIGIYHMMGEDFVINAQLIEVESGKAKHSVNLQGKYKDFFGMQDTIAKKALAWVGITPTTADVQRMQDAPNRNIATLEILSRANEAFFAGLADEAENLIKKALEADPANAEALVLQGNIQQNKGQYKTALSSYAAATDVYKKKKDEKNYSNGLRLIGIVNCDQGQYDKAMRFYTQSLGISKKIGDEPGTAKTLYAKGLCLAHMGKADEARRALEEAARHYENLGETMTVEEIRRQIDRLGH